MSETEKKLDALLVLVGEATLKEDHEEVEKLRPKITKLMKQFHAEEDEKKK